MWFGCRSGCAGHDGSDLNGQPIGPPLFFLFKPVGVAFPPPPHRLLDPSSDPD
jgi:hypothetical protein